MHPLKIYENERLIRYLVEESIDYQADFVKFTLITDFKAPQVNHPDKEINSLITEEKIERNFSEALIIWMTEYSGPMGTGTPYFRMKANLPIDLSKDECRKRLQVDLFSTGSRYLK